MATTKIAAPNYAETLWMTFSATVGSWVNNLDGSSSLINLRDHDFSTSAVSASAAAAHTRFAFDLTQLVSVVGGNPPGAQLLAIPKHNLTQNATIRVKAGTAAFNDDGTGGGTVVYDSGTLTALTQQAYTPGLLPWGHINTWTGAPDPIMDVGAYNRCVLVQFGSTVVATYWWVQITDTANPDAAVILNRLFLGPYWQPSKNFDYGVTIEPVGDRVADASATNAQFIDPNRKLARLVSFTLTDIPMDEGTQVFLPLVMYMGYDKQGFFIFDPSETHSMERTAFMVTVLKPGAFAFANYGTENVPLQLLEVI